MAGKSDKPDLEQLLSSYIDGTCSDQERQQVEEALQRDPRLRALHAELGRTVDAIRAVPSEAAPRYVRERILSQLERRALLGIGSPGAGESARGAGRRRSTGWLGLLAAAMLVAGVGVTWWVRMHGEKAPMQIAMAPTAPARDERVAAGEVTPQAKSGQTPRAAGRARAAGEGGSEYATKVAEAPSAGGHGSSPATVAPPSGQPTVSARPQAPVMADRGGVDAVRGEPSPALQLDHALKMAEQRGQAPSAAKPEPVRSFGGEVATSVGPAGPQVNLRAMHSEPGGAGDSSRLVGEMARSREAAPADAISVTPMSRDLAAKDAVGLAANEVAFGEAPAAAPATVAPAAAAAQPVLARSAREYWAGGRITVAQQLQVSVRDADRQVALANEFIRSRVVARGGRFVIQADPSVILVAIPMGRDPGLLEEIRQAPGVVGMQSAFLLPDSDPLARQAFSLAAEQQCHQVAHDFAAWASGQGPAVTGHASNPEPYISFHDAPPIIPQQGGAFGLPMVIVLQPVAPAAASQPAGQ